MVSFDGENVLPSGPFTVVLGVAQDGGVPHAGCERECCTLARRDPVYRRRVACLGIGLPAEGGAWLIDATPDVGEQMAILVRLAESARRSGAGAGLHAGTADLRGVLLTHAHMGHYLGLAHAGREGMNTSELPLFVMPRLERFLIENAPWSQLVALQNVNLHRLREGLPVPLSPGVTVTPWVVPHRGEFSETVAFLVKGGTRSVLYLPDIDDWTSWDRSLAEVLREVDVAYLDGTFFDDGELTRRDPSEVPHPRVRDTMALLDELPATEREKVRFLHLNHTNPLIREDSAATCEVWDRGYRVAVEGEVVAL